MPAAQEDMVPCTTCDGTGQTMYRGESHRTYDEPDYMDTCAICGGGGELPARMFAEFDDYDGPDPSQLEPCEVCGAPAGVSCASSCIADQA